MVKRESAPPKDERTTERIKKHSHSVYQRQTIFLTTDFDENSRRHRIEIAGTACVCLYECECIYVFACNYSVDWDWYTIQNKDERQFTRLNKVSEYCLCVCAAD